MARTVDFYYDWVVSRLVSKQTGALGLFPHSRYSHVRDNVICAVTLWAMSKALKSRQDGSGRLFEMEQLAIKTMRGILFCYTKQLDKLENFKNNQDPDQALHVLFDPHTGDAVDVKWNHMQMHTVSLYLFYLSQMIRSGLNIIYTIEECNVVQNLIYYIERSYRVKDFGTWGLGTRNDSTQPELSATSIGLAKTALKVCNNLNLFGPKSCTETALFVDPDAVFRNESILKGLSPRESLSKNVDAALLLIEGFPAFAIHNQATRAAIKKNIDDELLGKFGYQRFPNDQSELGEMKNEEKGDNEGLIRYEWPFLVLFQLISAIFDGEEEMQNFAKYQDILENSLYESDGFPTLPRAVKIFSDEQVAEKDLQAIPSIQALLILFYLLRDRHIHPTDLDFRINDKKFKKKKSNSVIQIALIAESTSFQQLLSTYGIITQTPNQIASVYIWPSNKLSHLLSYLGRSEVLGLTGRPQRPLGSLSTSRVWRIGSKTVVSVPLYQDKQDFYICKDENFIAKSIKNHIRFLHNHWTSTKRPTFCLMLSSTLFKKDSKPLLEVLNMLKFGEFEGIPIKIGRLQELIPAAKLTVLDCHKPLKDTFDFHENRILASPKLMRRSLSIRSADENSMINSSTQSSGDKAVLLSYQSYIQCCETKTVEELCLVSSDDASPLAYKVVALLRLIEVIGEDFIVEGMKIVDHIQHFYKIVEGDWLVLRLCGGYLGKSVDSLAPSLATIVVANKAVCFGKMGQEEKLVTGPLHPKLLDEIFHTLLRDQDVLHVCLQQEFLIFLAEIIDEAPALFEGITVLRIGWIINILAEILLNLGILLEYLPPHSLKRKLLELLSGDLTTSYCSQESECFLRTRILNGTLGRVPNGLYTLVWDLLRTQPHLTLVVMDTTLTSADMAGVKPGEADFALKVEAFLSDGQDSITRHLLVETLQVLATAVARSPELRLRETVDVMELLERAKVNKNDSFDDVSQKVLTVLVKEDYFAVQGCSIS